MKLLRTLRGRGVTGPINVQYKVQVKWNYRIIVVEKLVIEKLDKLKITRALYFARANY